MVLPAPAERFIRIEPRRLVVKPVTWKMCSSTMNRPEMQACATHRMGAVKQNMKSSGSVIEAREAVKASGTRTAAVFLRFSLRRRR